MMRGLSVMMLLVVSLWATKMTVSLESMVQKADYIVVAEALENVEGYKDHNSGAFKVVKSLKNTITPQRIEVQLPSLAFEKNHTYLLFLVRTDGKWHWIPGHSKRLEATPLTIEKTTRLLRE